MRSLTTISEDVYGTMQGPEWNVTGNLRDWDVTSRLGELALPVLVTSGRFDQTTPALVEPLVKGIGGAEHVVFEESSHVAMVEEPDRYRELVESFCHRVDRGPSRSAPQASLNNPHRLRAKCRRSGKAHSGTAGRAESDLCAAWAMSEDAVPENDKTPPERGFRQVRMRGLEPPRGCPHTDLNRARLPIPPHPRGRAILAYPAARASSRSRKRSTSSVVV